MPQNVRTRAVPRILALAAAVSALAVWIAWLVRRRRVWFQRLNDAIPVHSAWWREQRARPGELLYVALGDSAAQGIGASRPGRGYVGTTARRIAAASGASVRTVNLGIAGATTSTVVEKQLRPLAGLQPDICTLAIGANDIARFDARGFESRLGLILDALPPHAIVAEVPSFHFLPAERSVLEANRILRRLADERGLAVVGLHRATRRPGIVAVTRHLAGDLFHPNDRGHDVWANAFESAVLRRVEALRAQGV